VNIQARNIRIYQPESGFTLVELLVSLTILSVLMTMLFSGFRFTNSVEKRVDNSLYKTSDIMMAQMFIRRQIAQSENIAFRDDTGKIVHTFYGDEKEVRFIAPLTQNKDKAGLQRLTLRFVNEGGVNKLVANVRRYQLPNDWLSSDDQDSVVLYEGFSTPSFEYYGGDSMGRDTWRSYWIDQETLPVAMRVSLEHENNELVSWPELIVSTHVGQYKSARAIR